MSNLLSTSAMVTECQTRVPIGLLSTFWIKKLNEAFRWVSQKGNFIWDLRTETLTIPTNQGYFDLPTTCDPGKPMYLAGPVGVSVPTTGVTLESIIPFKPWDEALDQQYSELTMASGMISCWSLVNKFVGGVWKQVGVIYPQTAKVAAGDSTYVFVYHIDVASTEYTAASNVYFPTPNSFDNLMIELAEAEARRIYGLAGWEIIQKRAESAIVNLLDSYRSTKNVLAGMVDQQKQLAEKKMMIQERG